MDLKGKLALVTGSTSGIGLGIAHALAKHGCDIILSGFGDAQLIQDIKDDIFRQHSIKVDYIGADLLKVDEIEALVREIHQRHPAGIDILINNAGFNFVAPVTEYPDKMWDDVIGIHLSAPFHLIKRLGSHLKKKGWGRIVNMSSQMGVVSIPGKAVYSAAKSGLIGLTKGVALEMAEHGVTCNAVCPTYANTALIEAQLVEKARKENTSFQDELSSLTATVPTRNLATVEQIADLVVFLVRSEASAQITGAAYLIDGGFTAQ